MTRLIKKQRSQNFRDIIPNNAKNIRELSGENVIRYLHYPTTILGYMLEAQRKKLDFFMNHFERCSNEYEMSKLFNSPSYKSESGCLRWVYSSVMYNDGQERFEAMDDLSFNVRGQFCPNCELSRRMEEYLPIHYEVPKEGETIKASTDGYTKQRWTIFYEPSVKECTLDDTDPRIKYWTMSSDLFRDLLGMLANLSTPDNYIRPIPYSYECGGKKVFLTEIPQEVVENPTEIMDLETNMFQPLKQIEMVRNYGSYKIQIMTSLLNPFVSDRKDYDHVYFNPLLTLNSMSSIIHNLTIRITNPMGFQTVFICPEMEAPFKISEIKSLDSFVEEPSLYPHIFYNIPGISRLLMYQTLFLTDAPDGEITTMVYQKPELFIKLLGNRFQPNELMEIRNRLVYYKQFQEPKSFRQIIDIIRKTLSGVTV